MNEISLSSLSIYEFFAGKTLTENVFQEIKTLDENKQIKWHDNSNVADPSNYSNAGYLINDTSYFNSELFGWFENCVNEICKEKFKNINLKICDSWLTKTKKFQKSTKHEHSFSVLSGVFYFEDFENSNLKFYFVDPIIEKFNILLGKTPEEMYVQHKKIQPQLGKLVVFPSFLEHEILINTSNKTRYSLAFNTFFDGEVRNKSTKKLHIKIL